MASDEEDTFYCLCRQPYDETRFMIECDVCTDWFHGSCVGVEEHQASDIEVYHCPNCQKLHGPLVLKTKRNIHRHDYSEDNISSKVRIGLKPIEQNFSSVDWSTVTTAHPVQRIRPSPLPDPVMNPGKSYKFYKAIQTGTLQFIKELKNRHFPSGDEIPIKKLHGYELSVEHLTKEGFDVPLLVDKTDGLGLTVPPSSFTIQDVENYVGSMREIDVIDVNKQEDYQMVMREWTQYYNSPNRSKIYNVISLEFSNTSLSELVVPPTIVRKLSWASNIWPDHSEDTQHLRPEVQKYCLMGVKDSFTDFHVDFGGTSVWYHVLKGEKVFYLIRPTNVNLTLYEHWVSSASQGQTFFGDQADTCYKCTVRAGQTLFIPTGWIHAVLTPVDSLVFGGNFLHSLNIPLQLQVYDIERRVKTPEKYLYPNFETMHWYAAKLILETLKDYTDEGKKPLSHFVTGAKALVSHLKTWSQKKDGQIPKSHRDSIPEGVLFGKLVKELAKEVKHIEKPSAKPKPEKKKRKKASTKLSNLDVLDQHTKVELKKVKEEHKVRKLSQGSVDSSFSLKVRIPKPSAYTEETSQPSPTSLRLKLTNGKIISGGASQTSSPGKFQALKPDNSDSDPEHLVVDENPKKNKTRQGSQSTAKPGSLKLKLSFGGKNVPDLDSSHESSVNTTMSDSAFSSPEKTAFKPETDIIQGGLNCGIGDILEASGYGTETDFKVDNVGNKTMRDAIQGMLSMSQMGGTQLSMTGESPFVTRSKPIIKLKRPLNKSMEYDDIDKMPTCYKDEEFVYPTLEASDGEDDSIFKPRGRPKKDETWNPKAKLAPNMPKPERPSREGKRRESVESGLAQAAANLANRPKPKRQYIKKKVKPVKPEPMMSHSFSEFMFDDEQPGTSSFDPSSSAPASFLQQSDFFNKRKWPGSADDASKQKKARKGMATAKQRLGKLLKIHKLKF